MKFPSRAIVEKIKAEYPFGTRVELVKMDDIQAPPVGTKGTVTGVDDIGSIIQLALSTPMRIVLKCPFCTATFGKN